MRTGEATRLLVPNVGTKIHFPQIRDVAVSYSRLLLEDSLLREHTFRLGMSDTATCSCGSDRETTDHYLLKCKLYTPQRRVLIDTIRNVIKRQCFSGCYSLSKEFLLAPGWNEDLSDKEDRDVKAAVFQYISDSGRQL